MCGISYSEGQWLSSELHTPQTSCLTINYSQMFVLISAVNIIVCAGLVFELASHLYNLTYSI